jgi:diguanylate cyclase (GGDEF)-like protein
MTPVPDSNPEITQRTRPSPGPSQPTDGSACVVVIHGEGVGQRADIDTTPILVGRSPEAELFLAHRSVSRTQCKVWREGNTYRVRDLDATNTTRVNNRPIDEVELADGDHITVGESILKFISHSSVEAQYHEELYQLATHDALTDLYNRRHFSEVMDKEIARALRHGRPLTLCMVDVDLFKPVNDRYGHNAGDTVLRRIAALIRADVRHEDVAARIGGEEFAILLPECDVSTAYGFADRLRMAVADTEFTLEDEPRHVTISIGIGALSPDCATRSGLMAAADAALYSAKRGGRNRVCPQP